MCWFAINEQSPIREYPALSRAAEEETEEMLTLMARRRDMIEEQIVDNRTAITATQNLLDDAERRLMIINRPA